MHEGDLQAEHPPPRLGIDQLGAMPGEVSKDDSDVLDLVGNVMHAGTAVRDELPDRRVVSERCEQLDAAPADAHGCRLDALVLDASSMLELTAEEAFVRRDGLVEIGDREADVMDPAGIHWADRTGGGAE